MNDVDRVDQYVDMAVAMAFSFAPKLLLAVLTLIVGLWLINVFNQGIDKAFERSGMETTLRAFLNSLFNIGAKALLLISVASMVGIATTSFIAVLGAAGLAIGLALQGSLANFAGGVLILIFRPYKVGDYIEAAGHTGSVKRIEIFSTVVTTSDNKTVIIPNGAISNNAIINYSTQATRRVDIVFGIGYSDDLKAAKQVLKNVIEADNRIHKDPAPLIAISNLGESSVDITTRCWVDAGDNSSVRYDLLEKVKLAFDENGISIPYPQTDIHLYTKSG